MSSVYGPQSLEKHWIGRLSEIRQKRTGTCSLMEPSGVQVKFVFNRVTPGHASGQPRNTADEYTWGLSIVDHNGPRHFKIQMKAWLQSSNEPKYMLQDESYDWNPKNGLHMMVFSPKPIGSVVANWHDVHLWIEAWQLIEEPVVVHSYPKFLVDAFKTEKCANVTIKAGIQTFKVSEFILRTYSDVFDAMFMHGTKEEQTKEIKIENAKPEIVKKMLEFMYTGKVDDLKSVAAELLPLADQYQLKDLCDKCADQLCGDLSIETIIERLELVALYDHLTAFKTRVLDFGKRHFNEIRNLPGWTEFGLKNVRIVMDLVSSN